MYRCLQLAELGAGRVAPNPMVGAVLVHEDRIIGEGYHQKYGEAHAEVNCLADATTHLVALGGQTSKSDAGDLMGQSTLYVSLEPCAHFGKTPPCADLIIKNKIPKVVIGCCDPFFEVNGKGIEKLIAAGIEVEVGILEKECEKLNKRFFTFHTRHRPYIILKWAETADHFIAHRKVDGRILGESSRQRLFITNEYSNRLVHKWRSEEAAILVGTNTVEYDNPDLTTRLWPGKSPVRLIVDMDLRLPGTLKVFDKNIKTIVFNTVKHEEEEDGIYYYQVTDDVNLVHQIVNALYQLKIQSVIVEGGARLLQSFIDAEMWDEARVISNSQLSVAAGLAAPVLEENLKIDEQRIMSDIIEVYKHSV